ncbi:MAG: hypothetical protein GF317_03260 [Candidatus Lokiarchaeota archaeon]|nr:hypothetical protein [Candidatus Lokiarchaeota archaeon]
MKEKNINFELSQIKTELEIINLLKSILKSTELDKIQIRAAASSLHSIYNGIEKILLFKIKDRNIKLATEDRRHSELLEIATTEKIISNNTAKRLKKYLGFRHFFRHNYGFMLDLELIKPLIEDIENLIIEFEKEIL